jgi:uncharacterized protein GlcG (DUF336 family)
MIVLRNYWLTIGALAALAGTGHAAPPTLTATDVTSIIAQAARAAAAHRSNSVIAVLDREGFILGVYHVSATPPLLAEINAIDKAGTAAYLSSGGEAFTSRTAGYIIQPHFPPGIRNTAPGPLTGVGLSSLPFSDINHFRNPAAPAAGIVNTSLSGNPGGVPLYKNGVLVGAVGVDSHATLSALIYVAGTDVDEDVAVAAQSGYGPPPGIVATQVLLNGIRLPYTSIKAGPLGLATPLDPTKFFLPVTASTGAPFQAGVVPNNTGPFPQTILPEPSPFADIPGGEVRDPIISSPVATPVNGQPRLTQAEVSTILHQAAVRASQTRGAIRNPIGPAEVFIVVVDYYNTSVTGVPLPYPPLTTPPPFPRPGVLGSFRTPDATIFSYDVAAQKARTALFFSNNTMALSSRTVGFLAQGTYPPGINGTAPGPYGPPTYGSSDAKFLLTAGVPIFNPPYGLQVLFTINPASLLKQPVAAHPEPPSTAISAAFAPNPFLLNGITVFPGGFPLYRHGVLIGAVGVSGDGVDQDDLISASATVGFEAPTSIRADEFTYRGARLPYAKFPQNASL